MTSSSSRPVTVYAVTPNAQTAGQTQVIYPPGGGTTTATTVRTVERIVMPQASALTQQRPVPINVVRYMPSSRAGTTGLANTTTSRVTNAPVVIRQTAAPASPVQTYKLTNTGAVATVAKQLGSSNSGGGGVGGGGGANIPVARVGGFGRGVATSSCPVITKVASVRSPSPPTHTPPVLQLTSKLDSVLNR